MNVRREEKMNDDKKLKCKFMTRNTGLKNYIPIPIDLSGLELSSTAMIVYGLLLSSSTLSQKNGWVDADGHVYIRYTYRQLAADSGKSESTIKNCMRQLDDNGLIIRKKESWEKTKIYVMVPHDSLSSRKMSLDRSIFDTTKVQFSGGGGDRKVPTNYISKTNNISTQYNYREEFLWR